ncbi:hypothetical protein K435DRAFT_676218 [Dendrothele bispora CBS 962.96]|uniref:hAT-like transposase RNase-H fold domain-containing protein n=1 Tax=Dendrothele bispora (strain CBS 962.96) TaxID=1314807 RepID=A0A4S8LML1_DENBC|nr:hypothetical protein K435DRAFT_676218 [Dendrothele bispora CBS 962.96]
MIKSLETILLDCPAGPSTHVRCMGHTIQLVVGSILDPFKAVQKRKIGNVIVEVDEDEEDDADDGDNDNEEGEEGEEQNDQPDSNQDGEDVNEEEDGEDDYEADPEAELEDYDILEAVTKEVQTLAQKIHWSESLRAELKAHCKREHITFKTVKWIVKTRWNTYAIMFESVLHLRKALDRLCKSHHHDLPYLDTQEWELLQGLYNMLNVSFSFIPMSLKA